MNEPTSATERAPGTRRPSNLNETCRSGRSRTGISSQGAALAIFLAFRPILHWCGFDKLFSNPGLAELSLYVAILGLLTVAF